MKKLLICLAVLGAICSCEQEEESTLAILEERQVPNTEVFGFPLEDLFVNKISNGFFHVVDGQNNQFGFYNGNPVCHSDYPEATFQPAQLNPQAASGIYQSASGEMLAYFDGDLSMVTQLFDNCVTRFAPVYLDCSPGTYGGKKVYEIEECYVGYPGSSLVIRRDTLDVIIYDCKPLSINVEPIEFPELYWEMPDGSKIDPWCVLEHGFPRW